QYALGCTAFNLLTGGAPFHHSNPAVVITQHLSAPPPPIGQRRPDLAGLDAVIATALAKHPDERFPTCAEFAAALAGRPVTARTARGAAPQQLTAAPRQASSSRNPARGGRRGSVIAAALALAAALGVAAVVGLHLFRGRPGPPESAPPRPTVAPPASIVAPGPAAPAIKLTSRVTDESTVLTPPENAAVNRAITKLFDGRGTRLWVVYVKSFDGLRSFKWAEEVARANGFGDADALLAVATDEPSFSFRVPGALSNGTSIDVERIRRDRIGPAVYRREWARAAIAAANGLDAVPG
ncbi:MAG: TPM domain-containing protein, partial [Mycobacterium sp.]|nr:TPM domain-containing protein [Mycobacterium sp.]